MLVEQATPPMMCATTYQINRILIIGMDASACATLAMGVLVSGQNGQFKNRCGQRAFSTSRFIPTLYFAGFKPGSSVGPPPSFSPKTGSVPGLQIARFSRRRHRPSQLF